MSTKLNKVNFYFGQANNGRNANDVSLKQSDIKHFQPGTIVVELYKDNVSDEWYTNKIFEVSGNVYKTNTAVNTGTTADYCYSVPVRTVMESKNKIYIKQIAKSTGNRNWSGLCYGNTLLNLNNDKTSKDLMYKMYERIVGLMLRNK
jgi:hypothetical protein